MKQKPKEITKEVNYLMNARPAFVSIVTNGANQEPFRELKSVKKSKQGEKKMKKGEQGKLRRRLKAASVKKSGQTVMTTVRKLVFDKKVFKTQDAVDAFLTENNWEGYEISETKTQFVAADPNIDDNDFVSIKDVEMQKGLVGFVGQLTEEAAKEADAEDTIEAGEADETETDAEGDEETVEAGEGEGETEQKSERVVKFDYWSMYVSGEKDLKEVLADGMTDGVPPGTETILEATYKTLSNVLKDKEADMSSKTSLIKQIGADFAEVMVTVVEAYSEAVALEEKSDNVQKFIADFDSFVEKHADKSEAELQSTAKSDPVVQKLDTLISVVTKLVEVKSEEKASKADEKAGDATTTTVTTKQAKTSTTRKSMLIDEPVVTEKSKLSDREHAERKADEDFIRGSHALAPWSPKR